MTAQIALRLDTRRDGAPEWIACAGYEGDNGVVSVDFDGTGPDPLTAMTRLAEQIYDYVVGQGKKPTGATPFDLHAALAAQATVARLGEALSKATGAESHG